MSGIRFYWSVLRSVHACCLPLSAKQDGLRYLAFLFRRVEIAIHAFSRHSSVICLCGFTLGLCVSLWRSRRVTGTRGTRNGAGGKALVGLYAGALALKCFPRGVRWGSAPQTCAKESSTLWTLLTLRRGWVGAYSPRRHPGTRKDLTGSNLWPVRSCCIEMIPARSIVQTRAAPKRRRVGLRARSGEEAAQRPPPSGEESGCVRVSGVEAAQRPRSGEEAGTAGRPKRCVSGHCPPIFPPSPAGWSAPCGTYPDRSDGRCRRSTRRGRYRRNRSRRR